MIEGLDGFFVKLDRLENLAETLLPTVDMGLLQIEATAKDNASGPRPQHIDQVTGDLVRRIQAKPAKIEGDSIVGEVESGSDHGAIHEFGGIIVPVDAPTLAWQTPDGKWHHSMMSIIPPRPYLRPALESNAEAIVSNLGAAVRGLLE